MSLKRSHSSGKSSFGGAAMPGRRSIGRSSTTSSSGSRPRNETFTPVDVVAGDRRRRAAGLEGAPRPGGRGLPGEGRGRQVPRRRDGRARPGRVPEGVRARVARRFDPAARPVGDLAPQAEQRHDEAAAADRDRRARSLPRRRSRSTGSIPGRRPSRPRARPPSRRAPAGPPARAVPRADAAADDAAPGPQGLAVPSPASADAPSGPGDTGGHGRRADGPSPQEGLSRGRLRGGRHARHADPARRGR